MNKLDLIEKLQEHLDHELNWATTSIQRNIGSRLEIVAVAIHRGIGACEFCIALGVSYDKVEEMYYNFKEKVEALII